MCFLTLKIGNFILLFVGKTLINSSLDGVSINYYYILDYKCVPAISPELKTQVLLELPLSEQLEMMKK